MNKVWMIRPRPHHTDRMSEFLSQGIVAVGFPMGTDLTGRQLNELRRLIAKNYSDFSTVQVGKAAGTLDTLVNRMMPGHLVVVPHGQDIYFGEITGDYRYQDGKDNEQEGYPHQRSVLWRPTPIARTSLPEELQRSLRGINMLADISSHHSTVKRLIDNPNEVEAEELLQVQYPLRPNLQVTIAVPRNLTQTEANRLADFVRTLWFE